VNLLVAGTSGRSLTRRSAGECGWPPTRSKLASCLMSTWNHVPGPLPLVANEQDVWVKVLQASQGPGPFMSRQRVERGAQRALAMRRTCSALVPAGLKPAWKLLRIVASAAGAATTPSIRQCRYAACSNLEIHL